MHTHRVVSKKKNGKQSHGTIVKIYCKILLVLVPPMGGQGGIVGGMLLKKAFKHTRILNTHSRSVPQVQLCCFKLHNDNTTTQ